MVYCAPQKPTNLHDVTSRKKGNNGRCAVHSAGTGDLILSEFLTNCNFNFTCSSFTQFCPRHDLSCPPTEHQLAYRNDTLHTMQHQAPTPTPTPPPTPTRTKHSLQLNFVICICGPPLWSSGQSFWLQIQRSGVRFPARPDFLSSSGSGTGSTQPREPREVN
jgi:hypothetical protein